ncbi:hypothetical protein M409DRAFT_17612 [Zasmidium cellare ATCC 36951]|uniref:Co-chaperone HscB C-terminal oligomerisation domain-containing protein n=1 Tax=Zasmidium cellare ATCC 36951 TaxID=1080233 RepID=A0A6A6CYU2_ZASCE|nr:uncharacterized protein M409DRAFT_17612 [Zasmidium cellare ATCC 36951]KAF2172377.1 hypothetical protein M409DRAFT_17612 [Zasmidium cellare ATCC 36951]
MRRNTTRLLKQSITLLARETSSPWASRTPYICANCQASLRTNPPKHNTPQHRRALTTTTRRFQEEDNKPTTTTTATPPSHYTFFPQTFPQGPPPSSPFTPDLRALRSEFLRQQAKSHPDLAPSNQKHRAEALSARINEAYKTLQSPLLRAQYLLREAGIEVEDESAKLEKDADGELLMEVMEARERVEECEGEEELVGLKGENDERIKASVRVLEGAFAEGDLERARREAVRLRYWVNIEESIRGWEMGKGGGILHH